MRCGWRGWRCSVRRRRTPPDRFICARPMPNCQAAKHLHNSQHIVLLFDPASDTAALAALHSACFPDAWDAKAIAELLATPGAFSFHNQDGFVMARVAGGEAEILTLAVAPHARGRGLGRALL